MTALRNMLFVAALAGLAAGVVMTFLQLFATVPLILEAETFEMAAPAAPDHDHDAAAATADAGHDHGAEEWAPADGFPRMAFTALANLVTGVGFGLLLVAVSEFAGGRSPGSRVVALARLPAESPSGIPGPARRSQLRGQPRSWTGVRTAFPLAPVLREPPTRARLTETRAGAKPHSHRRGGRRGDRGVPPRAAVAATRSAQVRALFPFRFSGCCRKTTALQVSRPYESREEASGRR